tara:strand:+ start:9938 stop:10675 length:738 start_codon:yes stop_codon:yes gene_type:complete
MPNPLDPFGTNDLLRDLGTRRQIEASALDQLTNFGMIRNLLAQQGNRFKLGQIDAKGVADRLNTFAGHKFTSPQILAGTGVDGGVVDKSRALDDLKTFMEGAMFGKKGGFGVLDTPANTRSGIDNLTSLLFGSVDSAAKDSVQQTVTEGKKFSSLPKPGATDKEGNPIISAIEHKGGTKVTGPGGSNRRIQDQLRAATALESSKVVDKQAKWKGKMGDIYEVGPGMYVFKSYDNSVVEDVSQYVK